MENEDATTTRRDAHPGAPLGQHHRDTHASWPQTITALLSTYYAEGLDAADEAYAIAGLHRYTVTFHERHGHKGLNMVAMDEAAANEVWYQWTRRRQFRRAIAALSACWTSLAIERPERILDRARRIEEGRARKQKKAAPIGSGQSHREK